MATTRSFQVLAWAVVWAFPLAVSAQGASSAQVAAVGTEDDGDDRTEAASDDGRLAQEGDEGAHRGDLSQYLEEQLSEPERSFPYLESHGYFRFRTDSFWNLDLDTQGTSPILPPLEATRLVEESIPPGSGDPDFYDEEAEMLAGANIRFRYHPVFHITDTMRIHAEIDLLDNLVLGSTPDGFTAYGSIPNNRYDVPIVAFSPSQQVPNEDLTLRDSIRVRHAYAEMEFLGLIRVGRQPSNWGLGILANGGGSYSSSPLMPRTSYRGLQRGGFTCLDCDFGDIADRFLFVTRILETLYVGYLYDFVSQGTQTYEEDQPFGQPRDLSELDDVNQMGFIVVRSYNSEREQRDRTRRLKELHQPIIEGGLYMIFRDQRAEQGAGGFTPNDTESDFYPRNANAIIPDIWVRLLWEPAFRQRIRLELEAVGLFGDIDNVSPENGNDSRDIQQFGLAFESDFRFQNLTTGLNAGYASGRSTEGENARLRPGWGIIDDNLVTSGSDADRDVTNYKFDRDYMVDMIMFREIIGGITNAIYFDPFIQYNFFTAQDNAMGVRFDAIYALAPKADVTPGGDSQIGLELDTMLYYAGEHHQADIAYGLMVPFGAFDAVADRARIPGVRDFWDVENTFERNVDASLAHTLQIRLMWAF